MKKVKVKINGVWVETVGLNNKYNDAPVGTGQHLVSFYDYNGKVLKRQRVATGGDATAPTTPTHEFLTFAEWNNPFTNVQSDIDTGAIYNTTDGKTYLFITLTTVTGLAPTLYFSKSTTSLMTINWGDGTTSTSTTLGNQNINHVYSTVGNYTITVDNSAGGVWTIGQGANTTACFFGYLSILTKIYIGSNCAFSSNALQAHLSLKYIVLKTSLAFNVSLFRACSSLIHINIPKGITTISAFIFLTSYNLKKIIFSDAITTYSNQILNLSTGLISIISNASVTTIGSDVFNGNSVTIQYIFLSTTPPTLANINAFTGINPICKIYVPDASVAAYKAATNWNNYSSYIAPLSEKPISDE